MGGLEPLAELLKDVAPDRQIIVLGDLHANDRGQWPGKDGAVKIATALAEKLGRSVSWAMTPGGA
jgi:hypothetical protein